MNIFLFFSAAVTLHTFITSLEMIKDVIITIKAKRSSMNVMKIQSHFANVETVGVE